MMLFTKSVADDMLFRQRATATSRSRLSDLLPGRSPPGADGLAG